LNEHDRQIELHALRRPLGLTRFGMIAEQAVRGLWPLWTVLLALFVVLAFGWHTSVGVELFWVGGVAFLAAFAGSMWYAARHFRWVSAADAMDRLDRSMPGRPLTASFDDMAIGGEDDASRAVWEAHIARTKKALSAAKPVEPDLTVSDRDPFALRYAALLFFGVAVMFGSIWRLGAPEGVLPGTPGEAVIAGPSWEAWVEPPAYTSLPTIYLNDVRMEEFEVPVGSQITMRLYGQVGSIPWSETLSGQPAPEAPQSAFTIDIAQSGTLSIEEQVWTIAARADQRPKVWFQGAIERGADGEMKLPFNASDELDLPMPFTGRRDNFSELLIENMAEHPWAGLNVRFSLDVLDGTGQDSEDELINTTLPGRSFFHGCVGAVAAGARAAGTGHGRWRDG